MTQEKFDELFRKHNEVIVSNGLKIIHSHYDTLGSEFVSYTMDGRPNVLHACFEHDFKRDVWRGEIHVYNNSTERWDTAQSGLQFPDRKTATKFIRKYYGNL